MYSNMNNQYDNSAKISLDLSGVFLRSHARWTSVSVGAEFDNNNNFDTQSQLILSSNSFFSE